MLKYGRLLFLVGMFLLQGPSAFGYTPLCDVSPISLSISTEDSAYCTNNCDEAISTTNAFGQRVTQIVQKYCQIELCRHGIDLRSGTGGVCRPAFGNGSICTLDQQCASGNCYDDGITYQAGRRVKICRPQSRWN